MPGVIRRDVPLQTRVLSLDSIERRAAEIVHAAERRATELAQERKRIAEVESEAERQRGYQKGLEEGRAAGQEEMRAVAAAAAAELRREAQQNLDHLIGALTAAIEQIETERRRLLAEAESGLLDVALAIGRRVCGIAVLQSSAPALAVARELLERLRHSVDVELHVNPEEHDSLQAAAGELLAAAGRSTHVAIIADPQISRGGARFVTAEGTIDGAIETQLQRIAEALLGVKGANPAKTDASSEASAAETSTAASEYREPPHA
jgi:flagellar assembly protein FliH